MSTVRLIETLHINRVLYTFAVLFWKQSPEMRGAGTEEQGSPSEKVHEGRHRVGLSLLYFSGLSRTEHTIDTE